MASSEGMAQNFCGGWIPARVLLAVPLGSCWGGREVSNPLFCASSSATLVLNCATPALGSLGHAFVIATIAITFGSGPSSALQSCAGFGLISYILDFGGNSNTPPANAAVVGGLGGCCLAGPGLHGGQQQALGGLRKSSICGSQGLELGSGGPATIVGAAQQAGRQVGKLNKQWWQKQQRQRQQQLPPVVWLAHAMQPGYFKA
eukprot:1157651-Pelagomonas_calceolata.AAC.1